ncbi:iron-regulated transporter [Auriculariales sp. MPI-PUGE-AT-0066]|nr:iron-regulated transporter [Auriculariales sp. MPI-PUGE-AT-0066]
MTDNRNKAITPFLRSENNADSTTRSFAFEPSAIEQPSQSQDYTNLYTSHLLSMWNSRVFEFGAVIYMAHIFPKTLLPMSIYALFRASSAVFIAPAIGRYIDTWNRLQVVRLSIFAQRLVVTGSCIIFLAVLRGPLGTNNASISSGVLVVLVLFACTEKLGAIMNLVSIERDWVVVIAGGEEALLRRLNSQMRRIDLFCKLAGPLFVALLSGISVELTILINLIINTASIAIEYRTIARVYLAVPELRHPKVPAHLNVDLPETYSRWTMLQQSISDTVHAMGDYMQHRAFLPSFTCSILYFTVLSFSGQMITYLLSLSATWLAPRVMGRIGPIRSGIWFINWQAICLVLGVTAFRSMTVPIYAAWVLVGTTALSRVGLWGFDLSVQVIIQEEVEPERRGSFSTVEASWQNLFELCSYASTIIWSHPEQFSQPALISCATVVTAAGLFAAFVRKRRGHLVHLTHLSDCFDARDTKDRREYERLLEHHDLYRPFGAMRFAELSNRM